MTGGKITSKQTATKVARSSYSFVPFGELIWIFVHVLASKTSASEADSEFKTVHQRVWMNN